MALLETKYQHIQLDEDGVPVIEGANTKVVQLITELYAHGWSPTEMHLQHPHLTLGQIHSALAYYWDHRDEIDADVQRRLEESEEIRRSTPAPPFLDRLRHG